MSFTWSDPPSNGGSAIIDYQVWWDKGVSSFELLPPSVSVKEFTQTAGVSEGKYQFKIKARNLVGYSTFSSILTIIAAEIPTTPVAPSTQINGANVLISWTKPNSNGNDLTGYSVYIQKKDTTWALDLVNCDGGSKAGDANPSCAIPIATLTANTGAFKLT